MVFRFAVKNTLLAFCLVLSASMTALGSLPEPDNIYYGIVSSGGSILTADSGVTVSMKSQGNTIASYVMGDLASAGNYYVLKVPISRNDTSNDVGHPGDQVQVYVETTLASTFSISDKRGDIVKLNLSFEQVCHSTKNGELTDSSSYVEGAVCGSLFQSYTIQSPHVISWSTPTDPLSGRLTIENGGSLEINAIGNSISGEVALNGGKLDVNSNLVAAKIRVTDNSDMAIAPSYYLEVSEELRIDANQNLFLVETGELLIRGDLILDGNLSIVPFATVNANNARLILGSDLDLSGGSFITNENTEVILSDNITITSDQEIKLKSLDLNGYTLTLGSDTSDLIVYDPLVIDEAGEGIEGGQADITLMSGLTMSDGILRTSGTVNLLNGGTMSGGVLDVSGGRLNTNGNFNRSGGTITTDAGTQSQPLAGISAPDVVAVGEAVNLDGSGSFDANGVIVSHNWVQRSGEPVILSGIDSAQAGFTAPGISGASQTLVFKLTVTDDEGLSSSAEVSILVTAGSVWPLQVTKFGDGTGTVSSAPQGIDCGPDCYDITEVFSADSTVQLTAEASVDSVFAGWSETSCGRKLTCVISLDQAKTVAAVFEAPGELTQNEINGGFLSRLTSPYLVKSDLFVLAGDTLVVEPGVTIYFTQGVRLNIAGKLDAQGQENDPVTLTAATTNGDHWGGLAFENTNQGDSVMTYVNLEYAQTAISFNCCSSAVLEDPLELSNLGLKYNTRAVQGNPGFEVMLRRSVLDGNQYGLYDTTRIGLLGSTVSNSEVGLAGEQGTIRYSAITHNTLGVFNPLNGLNISNSLIQQNQVGMKIHDPTNGMIPVSFTFANNNILDNVQHAVVNQQDASFDASGNWWGTTDVAQITPALSGNITVDPVLTEEAKVTMPAREGLRGDIDNNTLVNDADANRFGQCNQFNTLISMGAPEETAYQTTGLISYADQCDRINDLNSDTLINDADQQRLQQCVRFKTLLGMGATHEQAEQIVGIVFVPTCDVVYSLWD